MAVTYTATPFTAAGVSGYNFRCGIRNVLISLAGAASEAVTLIHGILSSLSGACPHEIRVQLRSAITGPSGVFLSPPIINSLNQSQAVINFGAPNSCSAMVDIIAEFTHSIVS